MQNFNIPASKSVSNRLLILQHQYPSLKINNLSTSQDTIALQTALQQIGTYKQHISLNIGQAGTAMRFLTALLSNIEGKTFVLDGSIRMRQRPVKILVDALRSLGADITYLQNNGYPPLQITGKRLNGNKISIAQNVSSQYISALLLIGSKLPEGLSLYLKGKQVSKPYVQMTISILNMLDIGTEQSDGIIKVLPAKHIAKQKINIESDWSSASYFYGAMAILRRPQISLSTFDRHSLQGDHKIAEYFQNFGIKTCFEHNGKIILQPDKTYQKPDFLSFDLLDTPDLAQTLAVTCLAMGIKCRLTGLQTLRIKETDRLFALKNEMQKLGADIAVTKDSLSIISPYIKQTNVSIETYDDHRMAMSFAILQKKYPEINIKRPEVTAKSFHDFWNIFNNI